MYISPSDRWKVDVKGAKIHHSVSQKPVLQFVSIKRKDCGEWAIPGVSVFYVSSVYTGASRHSCLPYGVCKNAVGQQKQDFIVVEGRGLEICKKL